mgnify:CR=1 FL=1
MNLASIALAACGLAAGLTAQTTWIVNAGGGPGVHFLDLPAAVAAATHGDTIRVQTGPFLQGATPFITNKGLTILGDGGQVPMYGDFTNPYTIQGLAAGRAFRMAGFRRVGDGELNVHVHQCAGEVHLENLRAFSHSAMFPSWPAIEIHHCASVTLRGVETFGAPAVEIDHAAVVLVSCRLGLTTLGVGGGPCLRASNAHVDVVQPQFDPAWSSTAIQVWDSLLRVGGDATARVAGGQFTLTWQSIPIETFGNSIVLLDPAVQTPTFPAGQPVMVGSGTLVVAPVPASWTAGVTSPGQLLTVHATAPPGATLWQALGAPGPLTLVPFPIGLLGIDVYQPFAFFPANVVPASGVVTNALAVPASLPTGLAFAAQSVVLAGGVLELGMPVTLVLH